MSATGTELEEASCGEFGVDELVDDIFDLMNDFNMLEILLSDTDRIDHPEY